MSFSDMLNIPDVSVPLDFSSVDNPSSLSNMSSPTTFFDGSLLPPASISVGMTTPGSSTGPQGHQITAYIQLVRHYQQRERELKRELDSLK